MCHKLRSTPKKHVRCAMIYREVGIVPTLFRGADVAQGDGAGKEDPERESHAVVGGVRSAGV